MDYPVWPRVKEFDSRGGDLRLKKLRVFAVGENELFFSVLEEFLPGMTEKADYDEANVRISQSASYSLIRNSAPCGSWKTGWRSTAGMVPAGGMPRPFWFSF